MTSEIRTLILLSCGSFNPVNYMHLRMFELARNYLTKQNIIVERGIISPVNDSYPKQGLLNSTHRINMLQFALETSDWIKLDRWECNQDQWSKTFDVLSHFEEKLKGNIDIYGKNSKVMLLAGADLFYSFTTPGLWERDHILGIVRNFGIAIITRVGTDIEQVFEKIPYLQPFKENIFIIPDPIPNEISSTKIRAAISMNESVKYLLPDKLIDYIRDNRLYS